MKTLNCRTMVFFVAAIAFISLSGVSISYSSSDDDNHLSANDSVYAPPGYMNKDIQQARSLADKYLANKDKADNKTEATQRDVSQKVQTQAVEKPKPQLKQKQSSKVKSNTQTVVSAGLDSIKIGTGSNQVKDAAGRMISEVIDGKRYVYAGFDNVGKNAIAGAITVASAGDKIIVKSGVYNENISVKNGVSLYGGYNEYGARSIGAVPTIVNGSINASNISNPTEISGFTINALAGKTPLEIHSSSNLTFSDNTLIYNRWYINRDGLGFGVLFAIIIEALVNGLSSSVVVDSSSVLLKNNTFNNAGFGMTATGNGSSRVVSQDNNYNNANAGWLFALTSASVTILTNNDRYRSGNNYSSPFGSNLSVTNSLANSNAQNSAAYTPPQEDVRPTFNKKSEYSPSSNTFLNATTYKESKSDALASVFKDLLAKKNLHSQGPAKIAEDSFAKSAMFLPNSRIDPRVVEMAMRLASIMKNPTQDQKLLIDSISSLLNDMNKIEQEAGQSPELTKAQNELIQMVANILLAQAVPDLLKQGDVSNIKTIFSELDQGRNKIMLDYSIATKPYYENMIKDLAKNMAMLHGKNLLDPNMSKEELSKLPPSELDKILDKIRNMKDKSFEEKYLLQQEAKYRHDYLDPNNKKLESDMKGMLKSFTGRINDVLKSAKEEVAR